MKIPKGFELKNKDYTIEDILKLHKNVYVQKQASRVWY